MEGRRISGLPERTILYVSATVHPSHFMHEGMRTHIDPLPDIDFGRIIESAGEWVRPYIADVIDGTSQPLPADLSKYRGVIIGCSLHYVNPERQPIEPWQERVMGLIREAVIDRGIPYLGMCGGGQLGLHALGGKVSANPAGVGSKDAVRGTMAMRTTMVSLTKEGRAHRLFKNMPNSFGINAIHSDYLHDAPADKGFTVLANAEDIPNQIVAYGDNAVLMGVHPEISSRSMVNMMRLVLEHKAYDMLGGSEDAIRRALDDVRPTDAVTQNVIYNFLSEMCSDRGD